MIDDMLDDPVLSHLLLADECLLDAKRVEIFKKAIEKAVKPGDLVVDAGTGTGILALLAARARAKKVYALEIDSGLARMTNHSVKKAGYGNVIKVFNCDARSFIVPERKPANVLTMELLDTGLIAEHQASAILALKENKVIDEKTILIPNRVVSAIRLLTYDFNFYGFDLPITIQARNFRAMQNIEDRLSEYVSYHDLDLKAIKNQAVNASVEIPVRSAGLANALELISYTYFMGKRYGPTTDMNMPVIIPIEPIKVKKSDIIKVDINYEMSKGFSHFFLKVVKKK